MPPPFAHYSGWDAGAVAAGITILALHNPMGDVQKASFGTTLGVNPVPSQIGPTTYAPGTFDVVRWDTGITEGGSSGSGLFTYDPSTNFSYTRGTLSGGNDSCTGVAPISPDTR